MFDPTRPPPPITGTPHNKTSRKRASTNDDNDDGSIPSSSPVLIMRRTDDSTSTDRMCNSCAQKESCIQEYKREAKRLRQEDEYLAFKNLKLRQEFENLKYVLANLIGCEGLTMDEETLECGPQPIPSTTDKGKRKALTSKPSTIEKTLEEIYATPGTSSQNLYQRHQEMSIQEPLPSTSSSSYTDAPTYDRYRRPDLKPLPSTSSMSSAVHSESAHYFPPRPPPSLPPPPSPPSLPPPPLPPSLPPPSLPLSLPPPPLPPSQPPPPYWFSGERDPRYQYGHHPRKPRRN